MDAVEELSAVTPNVTPQEHKAGAAGDSDYRVVVATIARDGQRGSRIPGCSIAGKLCAGTPITHGRRAEAIADAVWISRRSSRQSCVEQTRADTLIKNRRCGIFDN
jgi:hypothetical protein